MIRGLALLLLCQLAGEAVARALVLPVPGPVLGLVLLLIGLHLAGRLRRREEPSAAVLDVERVSDGLLAVLALLFVPAGVGVVQHLGLIGQHGLALGLALVVSTAVTLVVTVLVFVGVARLQERGGTVRSEETGSTPEGRA